MDKGWIKLYRQIQDCWIWLDKEPFDKRSAWMDLLLTANHSDKKIKFNGELITIKRGQILTSIRKLSEKWKWSVNKVYRFINLLESDDMLQRESDKNRTLITIINYSVYQHSKNTNEYTNRNTYENTNGNSNEYTTDTPTETVTEHKQECKEYKNVRMKEYISGDDGVIDIYACAKDIAHDLMKKYWNRKPTETDIDNVYHLVIKINAKEQNISIDENKKELLEYAFQSSSNANATNWNYVNGVMSQLSTRGIETIDEAYEFDIQRKSES